MDQWVAERATDETFALAEGPVWDAGRRRLLWVDILAGAVLEGVLDGGRIGVTGRREFGDLVGAVAVASDGRLLVAARDRLLVAWPDGATSDGPRIVPGGEERRLNDGAVDPAGRFLVGTMSLAEPTGREVLVRWEDDGSLTTLDDDLQLSNGLAWTADGTRLFSVDTVPRTVHVRDHDPVTGEVGERRVHLRLPDGDGSPDGMAMDAEDHLWIAVWGAGEVRRHAPDGELVARVTVAAPHTSSVAFAGPDLRTLVITTAQQHLDAAQLREHPASGALFTCRVDVPGVPVPLWSGAAAGPPSISAAAGPPSISAAAGPPRTGAAPA